MPGLRRLGLKARNFVHTAPADDRKITILDGSVRSGKTFAMMAKLVKLIRYDVEGQRVIIGKSKNTVYRNVLVDLFRWIGRRNYRYNRQTGELYLWGQLWFVIGATDEGSEELIRGMTIGIAYSDETTTMPENFFLQLVARLSPAGARLYCTTNPANPYHYLKEDFIDNPKLAADLRHIHFTMDDNPGLSRAQRRQYERMYKGVFYLRYILGLWVVAEGVIYRDAWAKVHPYGDVAAILLDGKTRPARPIGLRGAGGHERRTIAIDYGTTNPTVFLDIFDTGTRHYVDREYYWDSREEMRQKTDQELADDFEEFVKAGGPESFEIIVDPSAASFIAELRLRGYAVTDADNEVLDGIRMTSALMGSGQVWYNVDGCPHFAKEMQTYAWNDKKAKQGKEEPIKDKDHAPDAFRYYVKTTVPEWRLAA